MTTLLVILFVVLALAYVLVVAIVPERTKHALFELKRLGNEDALRRERLIPSIESLRLLVIAVLTSLMTIAAVAAWQGVGFLVVLVVLLLATVLARTKRIAGYAARLYGRLEPKLLATFERQSLLAWFIAPRYHQLRDNKLESTEQLLHLVETSGHILDDDQRTIIMNGIDWHTTVVADAMTDRTDIRSVKRTEVLGPLVLDDLHRSGHSRFPVIDRTIDSIVGILDITELLEVSTVNTTPTAEKIMSPQALRIEMHATLPDALALLQKSHQHMLIVIDDDGKTAGIVTLSDITGSLLGKTEVKW